MPVMGDAYTFSHLEAPVFHPQAGHEMEGHVFLKHRFIAWPQRHCPLTPVRRIADTNGITGAVILNDAIFLQHREKSMGNIFAQITGTRDFKPCTASRTAFSASRKVAGGLPRNTVLERGQ